MADITKISHLVLVIIANLLDESNQSQLETEQDQPK